jgi:hypothetical protein
MLYPQPPPKCGKQQQPACYSQVVVVQQEFGVACGTFLWRVFTSMHSTLQQALLHCEGSRTVPCCVAASANAL